MFLNRKNRKWAAAVAAVLVSSGVAAATVRPEWSPGQYGTIAERGGRRILTVEVPEEAKMKQNFAEAKIDLRKHDGEVLAFRIRLRAENVSVPPRYYNGVKFMLHYRDLDGDGHWHNVTRLSGSFDWKEVVFSAPIIRPGREMVLQLGLQESSGKAEFDLDSLVIEPLFGKPAGNYRIRYPEQVAAAGPYRGVMSPVRFKEEDFATLRKWNANLVRAQLIRNWAKTGTDLDLADYDRWLNEMLDHYEQMFEIGHRKYGLRFVIDLHTAPGGRIEGNDMRMFYEQKYADHFIGVWKRIATRFKGNPAVWGYDLINEPRQTRPAPHDYWNLQRRAAEAVRAIDPDTPVIIESNEADSPDAFTYLPALEMDNVIYQVHMYKPGQFTHQRVRVPGGRLAPGEQPVAYPGVISGKFHDREHLRRILQPVRDFQMRHGARIYVGEFSAVTWAPGAAEYLRDCISIFEEYGWDWTYHAFRESPVWDLEKAGSERADIRPSGDNDRKRAVLEGLSRNRKN